MQTISTWLDNKHEVAWPAEQVASESVHLVLVAAADA